MFHPALKLSALEIDGFPDLDDEIAMHDFRMPDVAPEVVKIRLGRC